MNGYHYFWRADWFETPLGPYAVVMENGSKDINAINLKTGATLNLKHRSLGLGDMLLRHQPDGKVRIDITRGFIKDSIDDVVQAIQRAASTPAPVK